MTFGSVANAEKLRIVSTIKPLHLLVNGVVGEHAETSLLIPETMSTHDYSFRPSDLQKLGKADVIVRVADNLEVFLNSLLEEQKQLVSLGNAPGVLWLPIRHAHDHGGHSGHDKHEQEDEHRHEHDSHEENHQDPHAHDDHNEHNKHGLKDDPHIWLYPENAKRMAVYLAQRLGKIDPQNADAYAHNSQLLIQQIQAAHQYAIEQFHSLKGIPYLVFHDGWHYLEHAYGLTEPEVISYHEGLPPGVRTVLSLRQGIREKDIHCLITSPNNNQAIMSTLIEGTTVHISYLSPIGTGVKASGYPEFMQHNAEQFAQCLQRSKDVR